LVIYVELIDLLIYLLICINNYLNCISYIFF